MAIPAFLQQKQKELEKKIKKKKKDFRAKCLETLEKIKNYNEDRYHELNKIFTTKYDKINIQKKKVQGFYAQLVDEYKKLRTEAGEDILATTKVVKKIIKDVKNDKPIKKKVKKKVVKKETKKKAVKKETKKKKVVKKDTKKKTTKKAVKKTKKKTKK